MRIAQGREQTSVVNSFTADNAEPVTKPQNAGVCAAGRGNHYAYTSAKSPTPLYRRTQTAATNAHQRTPKPHGREMSRQRRQKSKTAATRNQPIIQHPGARHRRCCHKYTTLNSEVNGRYTLFHRRTWRRRRCRSTMRFQTPLSFQPPAT